MAVLTWRNVDAPNFAGSNEMWRTAANLMNAGLDRASASLDAFGRATTNDQSAALMQQIIAAGDDQAAIQRAVSGANPAYLSPEALNFANNQAGVLLARQGEGLQNTIRGQSIRANDFNFGRTQLEAQRADAQYAAMPDALAAMTQLRNDYAAGGMTPEQVQARQSEFMRQYGQTLGINDAASVGAFLSGNTNYSNDVMANNVNRLNYASKLDETIRTQDAKGIAANTLGMADNNPDHAIRMVQNFRNIDPETKAAVVSQIETLRAAMPAPNEADRAIEGNALLSGSNTNRLPLPDNYQPVIMNNRGRRNLPLNSNLNAALNSVLPGLGLTAIVTSGGQVTAEEAARGLGERTGSTRHDHGGAADVQLRAPDGRILSWERPADVPLLQSAVSGLKQAGLTGFGAAGDYMSDTTTHIGYGTPAVWGSKGGKPYQALLDAYNNVKSTGNGPTIANANAAGYQAAMDAVSNNQPYNAPINPNRVQIENPDGTVSTERTMTTQIGDAWFNIPTIVNGQELPEEQAMAEFQAGNNPAVGVFQTKREAESAAETRSQDIGRMIDGQVSQSVAVQEQNTADTNAEISAAVALTTPVSQNNNEEIRVNDRWTIPAVDREASQASQDWQSSQRRSAINGVMESIKTDLATSQGGGPLANWAGASWDYFMADPKTAADNAASREGAQTALEWYNSDTARKYFQDNPNALTEAAADPVGFQQRFKEVPPASNETINLPQVNVSAEREQPTLRTQLTNAETLLQLFSTAKNTAALNQANQQYQSIIDAVQDETQSGKSVAELATDLTKKDGALGEKYEHGSITQAIQNIRRELGVSPAIAAALLKETGDYSDGFLGFFDGYSTSMDRARDLWNSYQTANNADAGVGILNASDMTKFQREQIKLLEDQAKSAEQALKTAIADPYTNPQKAVQYQRQLEELPSVVRDRLMMIYGQGALDNNIRSRTEK